MTSPAHILGLATALPAHEIRQSEAVVKADAVFDRRTSEIERMAGVFANAGIDTRYACIPMNWYDEPRGWTEKNEQYLANAVGLLERAAIDALSDAGLAAGDIDGLVTVSTTGIATPSLEARLMERLPFRRDVWRLPVFGLGCAGGVSGLARAARMAQAAPHERILFMVVELCSLTFRRSDQSKSNIIATALFGDGVAAAVVGCGGRGPAITAWGEHCWPDSLDVMGWGVEEDGLSVLFSRDIPRLVRTDLRVATEAFLARHDMSLRDIDGYVCHPGGAKVLDALEEVFELPAGALEEPRAVLRECGNMSAATVLFILERMLRAGRSGRHLMTAFGPGFTAAFMTLEL